jgi:type IV secretion system protein VirB4
MHKEPIANKINLSGIYGDSIITKNSSLIGGVKLSGVDPIGLSEDKFESYTDLFRGIIQLLPSNTVLHQYYVHHKGANLTAQKRDYEKVNAISNNRMNFLNERGLSESFITHLIEMATPTNLNSFGDLAFLSNALAAVFDKDARKLLIASLSNRKATIIRRTELEETNFRLENELKQYCDKLGLFSFDNSSMKAKDLWAFMRFIGNLDYSYLKANEEPPTSNWHSHLLSGEVEVKNISGKQYLKISGAKVVYARIASIVEFGGKYTPVGAFASGDKPSVLSSGNYIIQQKFNPFSRLDKYKITASKRGDIHRSTVKFSSMVSGGDESESAKESRLSDHQREMLKELSAIDAINDTMGTFRNKVICFDTSPKEVDKTVEDINLRLSANGLQAKWESASLVEAFWSIIPSSSGEFPRKSVKNTTQVAALSQLYQTSEGTKRWKQTGIDEETLITLETEDGKPFGFNPFVGGKCVVVAVGPIRSGKSFTRATFASHNLKYDGYHLSLDVDAGTEPLVEYFNEISTLFKVTDDPESGFNLFSSANGLDDKTFIEHFYSQIASMIKLNSAEALQKFTVEEQADLDHALKDILSLDKSKQTLSNFVIHLQTDASKKLARFIQGGVLGNFFDSYTDQYASIEKRLTAFNLEAIKDNEKILPVVMKELFFRANRLFENPALRTVPKILDVDEAHTLLQQEDSAEKLISVARRIGKYFGGIWLWSQNPEEYRKAKGWDALRTAASAFLFMPDSEMDKTSYKETFKLSDGECDRISRMTPKKQVYIVQRDLGISTVININVDPTQFVINASQSIEREIRAKAIARNPNDIYKALAEAAKEIQES